MINIEEVKRLVITRDMINEAREQAETPEKVLKTPGFELDMMEIEQMTLRLQQMAKKHGIKMSIYADSDGSLTWARAGAYEFTMHNDGKTWDYSPLDIQGAYQGDVDAWRITSFTDPPQARTD